jgi:hypothetical protein
MLNQDFTSKGLSGWRIVLQITRFLDLSIIWYSEKHYIWKLDLFLSSDKTKGRCSLTNPTEKMPLCFIWLQNQTQFPKCCVLEHQVIKFRNLVIPRGYHYILWMHCGYCILRTIWHISFPGKYYIKFPCILWSEGPSVWPSKYGTGNWDSLVLLLAGYVSLEGGKELLPLFPVYPCSVASAIASCMRIRLR